MQTVKNSVLENIIRIIVKILIVNFIFYPIMFPDSTRFNNLLATGIGILISFVVGFGLRRIFNKMGQ